ncbi:molybdate ABC transporter substrate-binding protein [Ancylobacter dichloromethanicus]|uniref:Molybdate ABC transporter substrate-binding protein n=1 Tax=Ancylobacter dichloromethanicus TaxID=518825 RepID=A0A9W6J867_9HYPH|nr:molybdate ABC transporter substrate-binding protein [Ancylobacter dichloromethanicus]MBS7553585.1 molybdate ABC transporter substrate-binding protein [Ancylobacter dichloromethanicus]GLK72645.1 molybdate ABC transporter substrate-binding protein [Ancylobacter dichloromethanicus]
MLLRRHFRRPLAAATVLAVALAAFLGASVAPGALSAGEAPGDPPTVFAAASLTNAFQDIGKLYQQKTGRPVRFSFAASSALAKQLEAGAPAAIFASADNRWMDYTEGKDLTLKVTRVTPIGNSLVLIMPADAAKDVTIDASFNWLAFLGADGRIATGLTDSVPAGIYAKAALTSLGAWDTVKPRIVGAESVRAALALVERGEAVAGIVYSTDAAIARNVKVVATFPAGSHPPVEYPFEIVKGQDNPATRALLDFLTGPEAREVYTKYGFAVK